MPIFGSKKVRVDQFWTDGRSVNPLLHQKAAHSVNTLRDKTVLKKN